MNKAFILVFIAEGLMTVGQICLKKSANRLKNGDSTLFFNILTIKNRALSPISHGHF